MQQTVYSPKRVSVAVGLCIVMLAALPRYMVGGHETRQTLLLMALVLVAGAAAFQWRMLSQEARQALPALIKRLAIMLVLGALVMGLGTPCLLIGLAGRSLSLTRRRVVCCCMRFPCGGLRGSNDFCTFKPL